MLGYFINKKTSHKLKTIKLVTGKVGEFTAIHIQKEVNERGDIYTNCGRWIDRKIVDVKAESQPYNHLNLLDKKEVTKRELRDMLGCDCYTCMKVQVKRRGLRVIDNPIILPERKRVKEKA